MKSMGVGRRIGGPSTGDWLAGANAEIGIQKGMNWMSKESKRGHRFSWSTISHFGNTVPSSRADP